LRLRRIAFWSGFGLLALIVFAASWLLLADLGSFKPQIEQWASEKTGRQVSIDGALQINLARHSSIVAENIHVSNSTWAENPEMISIGRLEVRVDLRSIWSGPIVVELIDLDNAKILLTKPADGDPNWALPKQEQVEQDEDERERQQKGILFEQIDVDRVELTYSSSQRDQPIEFVVESLSQTHRDDDFLDWSFTGAINGHEAQLNGRVGTWAALLERQNVHFDLEARVDTFELTADGHIDDLLRPHRPEFNFVAHAPDINDLLRVFGAPEEGQGEIALFGSMTPEVSGPLVLDVQGQLGRIEIEASGAFSDLQDLEEIDIDVLAAGDDVRPILEAIGIHQERESPFMVNIDAQRQGKILIIKKADMLFGEARFGLTARAPNFPRVDDATIQLQINGPDIVRFREVFNLPGEATGAFSVGFTIDVADDGIEILNLDLQSSLARLHADGNLGAAPDYFGTTLNFDLTSDNLAVFGGAYGVKGLPNKPIEVAGSAEYTPDGIQTLDSVTATIGAATIKVDGLIKTVKGALGSDFDFRLIGPDLANLMAAFAPSGTVPAQPYAIRGQLQVRNDGYRFRDVTGKLGTSEISADGLLVLRGGIVGSRFNFAASGPAFEELIDRVGDLEVIPGDYEFGGSILFKPEVIDLENIELHRAGGDIAMNLELGLPVSRNWANFDLRSSGPDVRSILRGVDAFEADEAAFSIDIRGERRGRDWAFERLNISVGDASLEANGELDFAGDDSATRFDLEVNIPSTARLGTMDGYRLREQPFTLIAHVVGGGGVLDVNDMIATLGESDINGDVHYEAGDIPEINVDIESDSIVFAPLLEEREAVYDSTPDFDDGRLIPDVIVPFDAMKKINATVEVDIGELQRDTLHIRDVILRASLRDGTLDVSDAGFQAKSGAVRARASIAPADGEGKASVELVARDLAMGMTELNKDLAMTADIEINFQSTGIDLRSLFGNANGVFFSNTRGGRLTNNKFMHALYGDLLDEILGTINPFSKSDPYTNLDCVIFRLKVTNGALTSHPNSLVATDKIQIVLKSEIDLKSEALEMNVRTTPKKSIGISAGEIVNPYVKVVGSLASPRLAVDEKGILLSGGAAVATGGLSVLARAAWTRLSRAKDPCGETASEGIELLSDYFSDLPVTIVEHKSEATEQSSE
jgi:uncharacterized protein involved in outer membrane biogenesis